MVQQTASLVEGKPIEVKLEFSRDALEIAGDRVMLTQVVVNLLSNGIKYTERGTVTIALDVAQDERLGSVARIAVRDTGVGIRAEDRCRLFQEFTQLDTGGMGRVAGTGLGLVISARLVQLHGGRIDVGSEYGKGSEFTVLLPFCGPSATEPSSPAPANGVQQTNGSAACLCRSPAAVGIEIPTSARVVLASANGAADNADRYAPRFQAATHPLR